MVELFFVIRYKREGRLAPLTKKRSPPILFISNNHPGEPYPMQTVYILGTIPPGKEKNMILQLDDLLLEIENPTILYHGDDDTADMLRQYATGEKLPMLQDIDRNPAILYSRMLAERFLIILDYPIAGSLKAYRTRSAWSIPGKTAVILPNKENSRPHVKLPKVYPTGKISNSRSRRRFPR